MTDNPRKCFKPNDIATASCLFNAGEHTNQQVANIVGCKLRSISSLKNRMTRTTNDEVRYEPYLPNKRGRKKLNRQALEPLEVRLLELIAENPQVTKVEMKSELGVTDYTLRVLIRQTKISHKRAHRQPSTRNTPQLIQDRRTFALSLVNVPNERRIYLDETGFNLHTQENYGWAPSDMVPVIPINPNRGRKCTLVMAVSCFGIEAFRVFRGSCNSGILSEFVIHELNPQFQGRPSFVLLDNVRFHHSGIVQQSLREELELKFLPPYSPQLNPIEQIFALVKYYYKRQKVKREEDIIPFVTQSVRALQARENFLAYYRESNRWLQIAYRGENFNE